MVKVKQIRSADCVVGGFRYATGSRLLGSLLLGLYDDDGLLHHVGFTSAFKKSDLPALTKKFEALKKKPGFTGNAPGRPEPLEHGTERPSGNRSIRKRSWKSPTITSPADVSVMARRSCDGARTRRRGNAPWIRWSIAKENRSRCCRTRCSRFAERSARRALISRRARAAPQVRDGCSRAAKRAMRRTATVPGSTRS